jgi:hypothetical protein
MYTIPSFVFDSRASFTDMCAIGAESFADKSPLNKGGHRHAYTPVYCSLFAPLRNKPINFGEIGVAGGPSVIMWSRYFSAALDMCKSHGTPRSTFELMTVKEEESMRGVFEKVPGGYDVLIDDSSHEFDDQIRIIKTALPYLKPGGILIVEDIFRDTPEEQYTMELMDILDKISFICFYTTEHENRYSPGWNNDKLLYLVKS